MRRGVILGTALIVISLSLQSAGPVPFTTSVKTKPLIGGARLTRTLIFDGGALRLDPPTSPPRMSEQRALALWQSRGLGVQFVANVDVFFARATIRALPLREPNGYKAPMFVGRPSWVFIWDGGSHSCPVHSFAGDRPPTKFIAEGTPVEMIAADSSNQGVSYQTRGSFCGEPPYGPTAEAAVYGLSAAWRIIKATPNACLRRHYGPCGPPYHDAVLRISMPQCARSFGGSYGGGKNIPSSLEVFVEVPMTGEPCTATKQVIQKQQIYGDPVPPTIGLMHGFRTSENSLIYFDGQKHTLRFP